MRFYISIFSSSSSSPAALSRCRLSSSDASVSSSVSAGSRVRFTPRCLETARAYWMLKRFQSQLGTEGIGSVPASRFAATSRIRCSCPQNLSPPQSSSQVVQHLVCSPCWPFHYSHLQSWGLILHIHRTQGRFLTLSARAMSEAEPSRKARLHIKLVGAYT